MPASLQCNVCGETFARTAEYWHKQPKNADGLSETCKPCAIARSRAYYRANRERAAEWSREYRKAHPDARKRERERGKQQRREAHPERYLTSEQRAARNLARRKRYYEDNRDRLIAANLERRKSDPDKTRAERRRYYDAHQAEIIAASKKWREDNPEKARERSRQYAEENSAAAVARAAEWRRNNPDKYRASTKRRYEESNAEISAKRNAWRNQNPERTRAQSTKEKAKRKLAPGSFTAEDIRAQREVQGNLCFYCDCEMGDKYTIDHVLAIANGGTNDPSNIVLACLPCNLKKGTKLHFTARA
jgi:hypothetical protein